MTACFLFSGLLSAQESYIFSNKKHRIGFVSGYGCQRLGQLLGDTSEGVAVKTEEYLIQSGANQNVIGLDVNYDYEVVFFQVQYYYGVLQRKTWGLDILVQPQYNITTFKYKNDDTETNNGFEFGLNAGLLIRKNFFKDFLSLYAFISAGPHYVSGTPERQSKGFIFSDNFFVGLHIKLLKDVYLDIRPGFRHISNAGLYHPNGGVDNFVLVAGVCYNL